MSYRVLKFQPKECNKSNFILWKAQINPPEDYTSISTVLISDNITVNNRRTLQEWESLLTDNGFKFHENFDSEFAKEYIIFDKECVSFSFQVFACDINVGNYCIEAGEEYILPLLFTLDLNKEGTIFPQALINKINSAKSSLDLDDKTNRLYFKFFRRLENLADQCQQYEVDIKYGVIEK